MLENIDACLIRAKRRVKMNKKTINDSLLGLENLQKELDFQLRVSDQNRNAYVGERSNSLEISSPRNSL
jgi:hypothetical protein